MTLFEIREQLTALRLKLGGRAAGAWRSEGGRLILIAFDPAPDLPRPVAMRFEIATRSVELTLVELGIVRAAITGETFVSIAADLPVDGGSGHWLRLFGAARSVAVPILGLDGSPIVVVSVALGLEPESGEVSSIIRASTWE